jgi:hypothetical protein
MSRVSGVSRGTAHPFDFGLPGPTRFFGSLGIKCHLSVGDHKAGIIMTNDGQIDVPVNACAQVKKDLLVCVPLLSRLPANQRYMIANLAKAQNHRQDVGVILQDRVCFEELVESCDRTGFNDVVDRSLVLVERGHSFHKRLWRQGKDGLTVNLRVRGPPFASVLQDRLYPLDRKIRPSLFQLLDFVAEILPYAQFGDV